jgi:23S rRNA (cytidine1920-2'-O)/16S rRNA (cytidine1409-2'-O)-methyltransferase
MPRKQRLDIELVERGLVSSREKAQALILAGDVVVNGQKAAKPGQLVSEETTLEVARPLRYVSRGGVKLEAALAAFHVSAEAKVCLDVGTSTGGFTDCLLQHAAARVHAVDTGAGQIDWKLRTDPRVRLHEKTNARYLTSAEIGEPVDLVVCDVSFISATLIIPALIPIAKPDADWIVLVKPQFEVGRPYVGSGGIVRDTALHAQACERVREAFVSRGFTTSIIDSPLLGMEGNREFLLHASRHAAIANS